MNLLLTPRKSALECSVVQYKIKILGWKRRTKKRQKEKLNLVERPNVEESRCRTKRREEKDNLKKNYNNIKNFILLYKYVRFLKEKEKITDFKSTHSYEKS